MPEFAGTAARVMQPRLLPASGRSTLQLISVVNNVLSSAKGPGLKAIAPPGATRAGSEDRKAAIPIARVVLELAIAFVALRSHGRSVAGTSSAAEAIAGRKSAPMRKQSPMLTTACA